MICQAFGVKRKEHQEGWPFHSTLLFKPGLQMAISETPPGSATRKPDARVDSLQLSVCSPSGCVCGYRFHRVIWLPGWRSG